MLLPSALTILTLPLTFTLASPARAPASAPAAGAHLVLTSHPTSLPSCATYHGRVSLKSRPWIYYIDRACAALATSEGQVFGSVVPFEHWDSSNGEDNGGRLVWVGDTEVEQSVLEAHGVIAPEQQREVHGGGVDPGPQLVLSNSHKSHIQDGIVLVSDLSDEGMGQLLYVPPTSGNVDLFDRPEWALKEVVAISQLPLVVDPRAGNGVASTSMVTTGDELVPKKDVERVRAHLDGLRFSPLISTLLSSVSISAIKQDVRYLSGEDQRAATKDSERWVSRHSMSEGGHKASAWLLQQFRLAGFACTQQTFLPHFAPMVECELPGTGEINGMHANETVVIGAHFDSRGSFGRPTAPGADDDGSGTALILSLARTIHNHRLTFSRRVRIAAFAGEEQGLLGSKWYARWLKEDKKEDVVMMLQVDMIAYRAPNEPLQMARPDLIGLPEAAYLVGNISTIYVPELQVGYTTACCSDHQSFEELGIASTWVFERNGAILDPCYHNSCDLSSREGYSFEQIHAITRVVLATLLELAGFSL